MLGFATLLFFINFRHVTYGTELPQHGNTTWISYNNDAERNISESNVSTTILPNITSTEESYFPYSDTNDNDTVLTIDDYLDIPSLTNRKKRKRRRNKKTMSETMLNNWNRRRNPKSSHKKHSTRVFLDKPVQFLVPPDEDKPSKAAKPVDGMTVPRNQYKKQRIVVSPSPARYLLPPFVDRSTTENIVLDDRKSEWFTNSSRGSTKFKNTVSYKDNINDVLSYDNGEYKDPSVSAGGNSNDISQFNNNAGTSTTRNYQRGPNKQREPDQNPNAKFSTQNPFFRKDVQYSNPINQNHNQQKYNSQANEVQSYQGRQTDTHVPLSKNQYEKHYPAQNNLNQKQPQLDPHHQKQFSNPVGNHQNQKLFNQQNTSSISFSPVQKTPSNHLSNPIPVQDWRTPNIPSSPQNLRNHEFRDQENNRVYPRTNETLQIQPYSSPPVTNQQTVYNLQPRVPAGLDVQNHKTLPLNSFSPEYKELNVLTQFPLTTHQNSNTLLNQSLANTALNFSPHQTSPTQYPSLQNSNVSNRQNIQKPIQSDAYQFSASPKLQQGSHQNLLTNQPPKQVSQQIDLKPQNQQNSLQRNQPSTQPHKPRYQETNPTRKHDTRPSTEVLSTTTRTTSASSRSDGFKGLEIAESKYFDDIPMNRNLMLQSDGQIIPGIPGKDYPVYSKELIQKRRFTCRGLDGYFADVSTQCQVFYICSGDGAGEPMLCPNGTLFSQVLLVCDWWYNVEC